LRTARYLPHSVQDKTCPNEQQRRLCLVAVYWNSGNRLEPQKMGGFPTATSPARTPQRVRAQTHLQQSVKRIDKRGRSPRPMDTIVMILFGSLLCSVTALSFMELRRIRKKLESK
jgi:hypothetical protein